MAQSTSTRAKRGVQVEDIIGHILEIQGFNSAALISWVGNTDSLTTPSIFPGTKGC